MLKLQFAKASKSAPVYQHRDPTDIVATHQPQLMDPYDRRYAIIFFWYMLESMIS